MKRYEYHFHTVAFCKACGVSEAVQWHDSLRVGWLMHAFKVIDHTQNIVIKDRG